MENNMSKKIEKLSAHYSAEEFIVALKDEDEEVKRYALSTIVKKLHDMLCVQVAANVAGVMNQPIMAGPLTRGQLKAMSKDRNLVFLLMMIFPQFHQIPIF